MKESQTPIKNTYEIEIKHYNPVVQPSLHDIYEISNGKKKTEIDMLEQFYLSVLLENYTKNKSTHPDPQKLLTNIRNRDKKLSEMEKQLYLSEQKLKQNLKESGLSLKSQTKTTESSVPEQINNNRVFEEKMRKTIDDEYFKIKLKFLPILEQNITDSEQFLKLVPENDKVLEILYEKMCNIIESLKKQTKIIEDKAMQKHLKKLQEIQQKFQLEIKDLTEVNVKLEEKNKDLFQQLKIQNEERKRIQKQKNDLHTEIYRNHQNIVQKSNEIARLRQKLQINQSMFDSYERTLEQNKKTIYTLENKLQDINFSKAEIEEKYKQSLTNYEKLQKQMSILRRKVEQQLSSVLPRVRSQSNISSNPFKIGEQEQVLLLKTQIQHLQELLRMKEIQNEKLKVSISQKQKINLEKVINQWKNTLQKIVAQHEKELQVKNGIIANLEKQREKLKKQLEICQQFKQHQQQITSKTLQIMSTLFSSSS